MKKIALILCLICSFYSCKSTKHSKKSSRNTTTVSTKSPRAVIDNDTRRNTTEIPNITEPNSRNVNFKVAENIIDYAMKFEGVRYKYGGTDRKGMDCSGLVTTAFSSEGISLPRSSSQIALSGDWIDLKLVQPGDLMFFATNGKNRNITHVALVTHVNDGQVEFIHSTTKAGVIVSSLADRYWYFAFVQARRVL